MVVEASVLWERFWAERCAFGMSASWRRPRLFQPIFANSFNDSPAGDPQTFSNLGLVSIEFDQRQFQKLAFQHIAEQYGKIGLTGVERPMNCLVYTGQGFIFR